MNKENLLRFIKSMPIAEQKLYMENLEINIDFNCRFTKDDPLLFIYVVKPKLLVLISFKTLN